MLVLSSVICTWLILEVMWQSCLHFKLVSMWRFFSQVLSSGRGAWSGHIYQACNPPSIVNRLQPLTPGARSIMTTTLLYIYVKHKYGRAHMAHVHCEKKRVQDAFLTMNYMYVCRYVYTLLIF